MRIILLTHGGADLVIERLAELGSVDLAGVFIETVTTPERTALDKMKRSIKYDGIAATIAKFAGIRKSSEKTASEDLTRKAANKHSVPIIDVEKFHAASSIESMRSLNADLAVVYGTNIIKESVFAIPRLGSINLHQGLAPYYRGGPPVFWELFNDAKEVGLTVHFVASKVDTGDIVRQTTKPLRYDPGFGLDFEGFINKFRSSLREDSANLVAEAVSAISSGEFERIAQDISLGNRYRLPTKSEKDEMRRRLKQRMKAGSSNE